MTHLKRLATPETWNVAKKEETFTMRPSGAHEMELGMPLNTFLQHVGAADTHHEVEYLLKHEPVNVDGKRVYDEHRSVGLMDVVEVPGATYRIVMTEDGLVAVEVDDVDKPVKITGKKTIKGGDVQVTTMDGRNILVDEAYDVGDTLHIDLPSQDVIDHLPLEPGATILLYKGRHAGETAEVTAIDGNTLTFTQDDTTYETQTEYAFVVGDILA